MNTPPMTAEKLTPKMSPTMLHLDDGMAPLANPSFMYLDDSKGSYPAMYRTSLSKLTERGRQGRGRTADPKTPTKLLRSNSPIHAMLNNPPKMLKPEYMGISRLLKTTNCMGTAPGSTPSMILNSSKWKFNSTDGAEAQNQKVAQSEQNANLQPEPTYLKSSHEVNKDSQKLETQPTESKKQSQQPQKGPQELEEPQLLELCPEVPQLQLQPQPLLLSRKQKHTRGISNTSTVLSSTTECDDRHCPSTRPPSTKPEDTNATVKVPGYRFPSTNSTASSSSTLDYKEYPEAMNFEVTTSKDEFVLATQSKRSSYISSVGSANEDDLNGWFAQYADDRQVSTLSISETQKEKTLQTEHFSLRVKQLELQIAELRLQNEELRLNMTAHRTIQDRYMFEALHDVQREKENTHKEMERKMQQMEKQVQNYKRVIQKLTIPTTTAPVTKPRIPLVDALTLDEISEANSSEDDDNETTIISNPQNDETSKKLPESPRKRTAGLNLSLKFEK